MLDLAGRVHPRVGLIEEPALARHAGDDLEAHRAHGDEQEGDQQERTEELRVDGGPDARDPANQSSQGRAGRKKARSSLAQAQQGGSGPGRHRGLGPAWAHAVRFPGPAAC